MDQVWFYFPCGALSIRNEVLDLHRSQFIQDSLFVWES